MLNVSNETAGRLDTSLLPLDLEETPELWKTWLFGLLIITAASFLSPAAILMVPLLHETLYERIMVFLVAVGIGAMSGSCIFILIPQAFDITEVAKIDYVTKSWLMISALYSFFVVDRLLQCAVEYRRQRRNHRKIHASTLNAILKRCRLDKTTKVKKLGAVENGAPRRKVNDASATTHRHSLIIDEHGNVTQPAVKNGNGNGPYTQSLYEPKFQAQSPASPQSHYQSYTHHHAQSNSHSNCQSHINSYRHYNGNHQRAKSTNDAAMAAAAERRLTKECHDLEDDVEVAMVNNVLTRTLSTRHSVAAIVPSERPIAVQLQSANGQSIGTLPNGIGDPASHGEGRRRRGRRRRKNDPKIDVEVKVHEKIVIEKSSLEVASVAYMIIFGSSANNFVDGMSTGAAFSDSIIRGITIGLAVLSQQLPQELGTLAILARSGLGIRRALLFNLLPITLSYVGFAFGVFLDNVDDSYDSFIFAVSAGMYFYIFLGTLIPEIRQSFQEQLRRSWRDAALATALQFSGIGFGVGFLYMMN